MTGKILLIGCGMDRRWRLVRTSGPGKEVPGGVADILYGDFDRARADETAGSLKRHLPFNGLYVVRSGCEALEFLRHRVSTCSLESPLPPVLALLDEDLSGMAGHSILRKMLTIPSFEKVLMIILVGAGRAVAHRQWSPGADGYLEKPFTFGKLRACIRSLGASAAEGRVPFLGVPA
jgi:DNA-binding response OmpR family regulator